jgi:hypothetical protein
MFIFGQIQKRIKKITAGKKTPDVAFGLAEFVKLLRPIVGVEQ